MDRLAIITGAGQGIGRALVLHFLGAKWRVAGLDVDAEALTELESLCGNHDLLALRVDVGREEQVAHAFTQLDAWQVESAQPAGHDLLVNNAGIADAVSGPIEHLALADWMRWQDSHLTGAFLCTRAAVPGLRARRGSIVNIASTRALQSEPHGEAYAAAKGGLLALTHALAVSLGPAIRVNAVCPGWIETGPWKKESGRHLGEHRDIDRTQHPVGRVGTPSDVAAVVDFLASPGAGFMTGEQLVLDGGMTRRMRYEA